MEDHFNPTHCLYFESFCSWCESPECPISLANRNSQHF